MYMMFLIAFILIYLCFLLTAKASLKSKVDMKRVKLGSSALRVSEVCLGTMTWGQQNTIDEGVAQLEVAFKDYGVNFLDTAEIYPVPTKEETQGETDKTVAKFLATSGIPRSEVVLATKVAGPGVTYLPGRNGEASRVSKDQIRISVDESLRRLQTDYIDLLQIHWPDRYVPLFGQTGYEYDKEREAISFQEQIEALNEIVKSGKVRYIGVSNETPYGVMRFGEEIRKSGGELPNIVSIQNSYSLITRTDYESGGLAETCSPRNENIGLLAYSPLAGGILTGKYNVLTPDPNARLNLFTGYMARYKQSLASDAVAEYEKVAKKHGFSTTELALAWCYQSPHVASTIIGATTQGQLNENLNAYAMKDKITEEVLADIETVYKRYKDPAKI